MSVIIVNKENFKEEILNSEKRVLLDFFAEWCGPCRMVAPILSELAEEHPEFVIAKVNVDKEPELASEFGVMSIPTLVVLEKGEVINRVTGARPKAALLSLLEK